MNVLDATALVAFGVLAAVWLGYPAVIGVLAMLRRRRVPDPTGEVPFVSVVLATREEPEVVRARVEDCLATSHPPERLEVVVAWDVRSGAAREATDWPAGVRHVVAESRGKPGALNAGVAAARGEVIVFADSHQRFERDTISRLVTALSVPGVGAASGRLELGSPSSLVARYWAGERWLRRQEARLHSAVGATGAVYAMRAGLWEPLPSDLLLDDVYVPMRLVLSGWRVGFVDEARAHETRAPSARHEYARKVRTLTGILQLCVRLPGLLNPIRNPIWTQFVFHKLLRLATPYAVALIAIWGLARAALVLGPAAPVAAAGVVTAAVWLARTRSGWGTRLRGVTVEGMLMQVAVVTASINGLRGHWQVWDG